MVARSPNTNPDRRRRPPSPPPPCSTRPSSSLTLKKVGEGALLNRISAGDSILCLVGFDAQVDRCVVRLQELQYTVAGGAKVVSGVSLSPRSTRGYLRTSLRCKQETVRQELSIPNPFDPI